MKERQSAHRTFSVTQDKKTHEGIKYHRSERSSTWVRRSLRLPEHADLAKVSAKYTDGVLHVSVRHRLITRLGPLRMHCRGTLLCHFTHAL